MRKKAGLLTVIALMAATSEAWAQNEPVPFIPVLEETDLPPMEEARVLRGTQFPIPDPNPNGMTLKQRASVRGQMSRVKNQSARGTCSVFAAVALMEASLGVSLSEQCLAQHMGTGDPGHIIKRLHWAVKHPLYLSNDCPYDARKPGLIPDLGRAFKWHPRMRIETESFGWFSREDPVAFIRKAVTQGKPVGASVIVAGHWWRDSAETPTRLRTNLKEKITIRLPPPIALSYPNDWPADWPAPNPDGTLTRETWEWAGFDMVQAIKNPQHRDLLRKHWYKEGHYPTGMFWDPKTRTGRRRSFEEFFASASRLEPPNDAEVSESCKDDAAPTGKKKCSSHAIVFTGYDDDTQTLEFKNSWGTDWKNDGYGYMSYAYYRRFHVGFSDDTPLIAITNLH